MKGLLVIIVCVRTGDGHLINMNRNSKKVIIKSPRQVITNYLK